MAGADQFVNVAEKLKDIKNLTSSISDNWAALVGAIGLNAGAISKLVGFQESALRDLTKRKERIAVLDRDSVAVQNRLLKVAEDVDLFTAKAQEAREAGDRGSIEAHTRRLVALVRERNELEGNIKLYKNEAEELLTLEHATAARSKTLVVAAAQAVAINMIRRAIVDSLHHNRILEGANSLLDERIRLFRNTIDVQIAVGSSLSDIAESTEYLRQNGLLYFGSMDAGLRSVAAASDRFIRSSVDSRPSTELRRSVEIVEQLRHGLGMSASEAARMAAQSRLLGTSFQEVANVLATVQDRTSMTSQQVMSLADAVGDTLRSLGREGSFDAAIRDASALENSLIQVGARAGSAAELIRSFSDIGAKGGMAMALGGLPGLGLGTGDEFRGFIERVGRQLEGPLKAMQRNPGNWAAVIQFESLARQFGLTRRTALELVQASKLLEQQQKDLAQNTKSSAERFREQSLATGAVWGQLFRSIKGLMEFGLRPLTLAVAHLNDAISETRVWFNSLDETTRDVIRYAAGLVSAGAALGTVVAATGVLLRMLRFVPNVLRSIFGVLPKVTPGLSTTAPQAMSRTSAAVPTAAPAATPVAPAATATSTVAGAGKAAAEIGVYYAASSMFGRLLGRLRQHAELQGPPDLSKAKFPKLELKIGNVLTSLRMFFASKFTWTGISTAIKGAAGSLKVAVLSAFGVVAAAVTVAGAAAIAAVYLHGKRLHRELREEFDLLNRSRDAARRSAERIAERNAELLNAPNRSVSDQLDAFRERLEFQKRSMIDQAGRLQSFEELVGARERLSKVLSSAASALNDRISQQALVLSRVVHTPDATVQDRAAADRDLSLMLEELRRLVSIQKEARDELTKRFHDAQRAQKELEEQRRREALVRPTSQQLINLGFGIPTQ